ncbi:hypothetical protein BDW72DRAFT_184536 [Aspergillus terricola var. indicus]
MPRQEAANSSGPSDLQPPAQSQAESSTQAAPVSQCKWIGCRSSTPFIREADLIRHLRSVHIAPNAFFCDQHNCGKRFGRKDHLKAHLKTHQRRQNNVPGP